MKKLTHEQLLYIKLRSSGLTKEYMQQQGYDSLDVIGNPEGETELLIASNRAIRETIMELAPKPDTQAKEKGGV